MLPVVASVVSLLAAQDPAPIVEPAPAVAPVPVVAPAAVVEPAPVVPVPVVAVPVEPMPEPVAAATPAPFSSIDSTWMNGQSHQRTFPLGVLNGVVTPSLYLDTHYAFSLNQPIDHTLTGSASIGRHNEFTINLASVGVEWNVANVVGRLSLQFGSTLNVVQDLDGTVLRGRNATTEALKHIREATAGYHFDVLHGVNVEAGIFMSYVGLESYLLAENWSYNRSIVCEFTPFYFTGVRAQVFVTDTLKVEPWLMNGYQTYGKFNEAPAVGLATRWNPAEWLALIGNVYVGTDTRGDPERVRFHHDHSILWRAFQDKDNAVLSKLAFSVNNHVGFERGGSAGDFADNHFLGTAISARAWTMHDLVAVTARFDHVQQPGGYSLQYPPPGFVAGRDFSITGLTAGLEIMPTDFFSVRPEVIARHASQPFFAGAGGTTSPSGYRDALDTDFVPDVVNDQVVLSLAATFRL
ncbi:MAG TPA: outer membrane beta-barrel protein [Myxococcota bacterium]